MDNGLFYRSVCILWQLQQCSIYMCAIVIDMWIFLTRGLLCMYVQSCHRTCFKGFLTHNFMDQCLLLISFHLNMALTEEY